MAMTATIALQHASVQVNQKNSASLAISNSGPSDINVLSITPLVRMTGSSDPTTYNSAVALGEPDLGPGVPITVPAGGSLTFAFGVTGFAPTTNRVDTGSGTYDVLAEVRTSDGSEFRPTPAVLTVHPLPSTQPQYSDTPH